MDRIVNNLVLDIHSSTGDSFEFWIRKTNDAFNLSIPLLVSGGVAYLATRVTVKGFFSKRIEIECKSSDMIDRLISFPVGKLSEGEISELRRFSEFIRPGMSLPGRFYSEVPGFEPMDKYRRAERRIALNLELVSERIDLLLDCAIKVGSALRETDDYVWMLEIEKDMETLDLGAIDPFSSVMLEDIRDTIKKIRGLVDRNKLK